ncbi:lipase member H-B-like isoform X3 [Plodia interpunctella]|uniref:lipase member H-B-like isoform X3 n=1 Tax=Plodia interpunctella TaxID=58824 RepID=UPI0023684D66|nr:lipase member H-B-like isoform X3 [Plodia interpunctella]
MFKSCPGSLKPVTISKENLRYVEIYVSGAKAPQGKRILYTYQTMAAMAKDPTMDYSRRTLFYIGGYMDTADYPLGTTMEIFYKKKGYNVWLLDALRFMINEYPVAVRFMPTVAEIVVDMIINLEKANVGFDPKKFDLAGFSLGAQTMGYIGKYYRKRTGVKFSRMTALDPSGLCFRNRKPDERLDTEDADEIVAIMTNIDNWGSPAPVGHVNFYVNGGEKQPGQIQWTKCEVGCSHFRAYFLNLAALDNDDQFIGVKCNSVQEARDNQCYRNKPLVTNVAGWNTNFSNPGIFYLPTGNIYPYFIGKRGLKEGNDAFSVNLRAANKDDIVYL